MQAIMKKTLIGFMVSICMGIGLVQADGHMKHADMSMHHMHVMINHALEMAVEGSNMMMLGQMKMAEGVDEISISHGKMMLDHAKELLKQVMEGEAMHALHHGGSTPEGDAAMAYTHELADKASEYIKLLEQMGNPPMDGAEHKH